MRRPVPAIVALASAVSVLALGGFSAAGAAPAPAAAAVHASLAGASPASAVHASLAGASPAAPAVHARLAADAAVAPAAPPANVVAPGQAFTGRVNGAFSAATVLVFCPGPLRTGQKGHPLAGQQLEVLSPLPPVAHGVHISVGQTGSRGRAIRARFAEDRSIPTVFVHYFVNEAIPTALLLPCGGTGKVLFTPVPASPTSRPSVVTVSYVNPAVSPLPTPSSG